MLLDAVHTGRELVKPLVGLLCSACGRLSRRIRLLGSLVDRGHPAFERGDAVVDRRDVVVDLVFGRARAEAEATDDDQASCRDALSNQGHVVLPSLWPRRAGDLSRVVIHRPDTADFWRLTALISRGTQFSLGRIP